MRERGKWYDFDKANIENNEIEDGEQVLVYLSNHGIEFLTFNETYQVFDDSEGDDIYCHFDRVEKYMLIPKIIY